MGGRAVPAGEGRGGPGWDDGEGKTKGGSDRKAPVGSPASLSLPHGCEREARGADALKGALSLWGWEKRKHTRKHTCSPGLTQAAIRSKQAVCVRVRVARLVAASACLLWRGGSSKCFRRFVQAAGLQGHGGGGGGGAALSRKGRAGRGGGGGGGARHRVTCTHSFSLFTWPPPCRPGRRTCSRARTRTPWRSSPRRPRSRRPWSTRRTRTCTCRRSSCSSTGTRPGSPPRSRRSGSSRRRGRPWLCFVLREGGGGGGGGRQVAVGKAVRVCVCGEGERVECEGGGGGRGGGGRGRGAERERHGAASTREVGSDSPDVEKPVTRRGGGNSRPPSPDAPVAANKHQPVRVRASPGVTG